MSTNVNKCQHVSKDFELGLSPSSSRGYWGRWGRRHIGPLSASLGPSRYCQTPPPSPSPVLGAPLKMGSATPLYRVVVGKQLLI